CARPHHGEERDSSRDNDDDAVRRIALALLRENWQEASPTHRIPIDMNIQGAMTAMVTPFREGKVDEQRLREQVEFQIKNGIDGLVPVGTTGESPTLDFK